jgi:hypothetical protein
MNTRICMSITVVLVGQVFAANLGPKDEVVVAAKQLADQPNYGWKTTVVVPEGTQFRPGPTEGKTEKDGLTHFVMSFGDNKIEVVSKGDKIAILNREGAWQSVSELDNAEGPARFVALLARNARTPAAQAAELASFAKDLKKDGDSFASDLTEDGAKMLLRLRSSSDGPTVSNAKGSVKFWLKDGRLEKYEFKLQGIVNFGGNNVDVDRTTTVEIREIGKTKVQVSEEAKKIVSTN